jgi:hypothetical protein
MSKRIEKLSKAKKAKSNRALDLQIRDLAVSFFAFASNGLSWGGQMFWRFARFEKREGEEKFSRFLCFVKIVLDWFQKVLKKFETYLFKK